MRLYGVIKFPVLHDELMSILDGVQKTKESLISFFFKASLENTMGMTPLYFWIERFFTDVFGKNNWGLRFFPLVSGIVTIYLAYWVIKKEFGKNVALFCAFLVAFSDTFLWATSKAQFFEVILVPLSFLVFYFLTTENRNKYYWISLCFSLMLLTYFGKGFFLFFVFLFWYGISKFFDWIKLKQSFKMILLKLKKELLQLSSFLSLPLIWLVLAHFFVFKRGVIENVIGLGRMDSIWKMVYLTTFGYGIHTKQFLANSPRGAFLVFDNLHIWPVTTLLFVPFLVGLLILIQRMIKNWKKGNPSFKKDSFLFVSSLSFLLLVLKGIISARFHLFYFVPFLILTSLGIKKLFSLFQEGKNKVLTFIFFLAWGIHISYASSWENWYYVVFDWSQFFKILSIIIPLILGFLFLGFFTKIDKKVFAKIIIGLLLFFLVGISFFFGPLLWGIDFAWEPAFDNKLNYLEGNEESVIDFAIKKNNPEICQKLPQDYKEKCSASFLNKN